MCDKSAVTPGVPTTSKRDSSSIRGLAFSRSDRGWTGLSVLRLQSKIGVLRSLGRYRQTHHRRLRSSVSSSLHNQQVCHTPAFMMVGFNCPENNLVAFVAGCVDVQRTVALSRIKSYGWTEVDPESPTIAMQLFGLRGKSAYRTFLRFKHRKDC